MKRFHLHRGRRPAFNAALLFLFFSLFGPVHFAQAQADPAIVAIEYFFDSATDFGAGNMITVTGSVSVIDESLSIALTDLDEGFHVLCIRLKDSDDEWSHTSVHPFYLLRFNPTGQLPEVVAAEYFLDTDPGLGLGVAITPIPGTFHDTALTADLSLTPEGTHILFIRTQDDEGNWSLVTAQPFYALKFPPGSEQTVITAAEYFFDTDPGQGSGSSIPVTDGMINPTHNIDLAAVSEGTHLLFIRAQDAEGNWSLVTAQPFYALKFPLTGETAVINEAEYFFDADPGQGSGTSLAIATGAGIEQASTIDLSLLPEGTHVLFMRLKDAEGNWGVPSLRPFYNDSLLTGGTPVPIFALEYFLTESGVTMVPPTVLGLASGVSIDSIITADLSTLNADTDYLIYLRLFDEAGTPSHTFSGDAAFTALKAFDLWRREFFSESELGQAEVSGILADPDSDGLPNLLEFAFGLQPINPDAGEAMVGPVEATGGVAISYRQRSDGSGTVGVDYAAAGLRYTVESSSSLEPGSWTSGSEILEIVGAPTDNFDGTETVTVRIKESVSTGDRHFLRLNITLL